MRYLSLLLVTVVVVVSAVPALGFKTGWPFDNVHLEIFNSSLPQSGFSADAIAHVNEGHMSEDDWQSHKFWEDRHHCDGNMIREGYDHFRARVESGIERADDCYKDAQHCRDARFRIGEGFHALQDFYSHSNWLEMQLDKQSALLAFPWESYTSWSYNKATSQWERPWKANFMSNLKTGYFTEAEFVGTGGKFVRESTPSATSQRLVVLAKIAMALAEIAKDRNAMIDEARQKDSSLRFSTEAEFKKRVGNQKFYHAAVEYVMADQGKQLLHLELNKDDDKSMEGSLVAPNGNTLHLLAKNLAIQDTARSWKQIEGLIWNRYAGCTALILPALKGQALPKILMKVTIDRSQQARDRPIKGNIKVTLQNLPSEMKAPLKIKVKMTLQPTNDPGQREPKATKVLEFKDTNVQDFALEPLNLVIGNRTGPYELYVKACFECDENFQPNEQHIALGGTLEIKSAKCIPNNTSNVGETNTLYVGETGKLQVFWEYDDAAEVFGQGVIRSEDGTTYARVLEKKRLNPTRAGPNMELPPYEESWTPPRDGKYFWSPRLSTAGSPDAQTKVEIVVKPRADKMVTGGGTLNKTDGEIGDRFVLTVPYRVSGVARGGTVRAEETSQIGQVDGQTVFSSIQDPPVTLNSPNGEPIKRTVTLTYTAAKAGVFDWRFRINVPGYGTIADSLRFTVNTAKNLVIDQESVSPESGPKGTQFTLTVRYHLRGMKTNDRQEITEATEITRTENIALPPRPRFQIHESDPKGTLIERCDKATKPGVYVWTYDIDAGPYGRERRSVTFRVTEPIVNRDIQLISASVSPVKGVVGTTHTLTVRYKLIGLKPGESVEVHENDYVEYSKQEAHSTETRRVTEPRVILTKVAGFVSKYAGKHRWNFVIDSDGFKTLYGSVPFEAYEQEVLQRLNARLDYPMVTLAPGETKNCSTYIRGYKTDTQDRVEIVYPQISDNWGSLPGQIQVFPGNTSMDPWSMRGAGDYTKEYASSTSYRARETAPPGVTSIQIIVRQKGAGQVTLTLFIKVVKKGESTFGTERKDPLLPGPYSNRVRRPGEGEPIGPAGVPDQPTKERQPYPNDTNRTNPDGTPSDTPDTTDPAGTPQPDPSRPGTSTQPDTSTPPGTPTRPDPSTTPSGPPGLQEESSEPGSEEEVVYELSHVDVSRWNMVKDEQVKYANGDASVQWQDERGNGKVIDGIGVIHWSFPKYITLRPDKAKAGFFSTTFETTLDARVHIVASGFGAAKDPTEFGVFLGPDEDTKTTLEGNGKYDGQKSRRFRVRVEETPTSDISVSSTKSKLHHSQPLLWIEPDYRGLSVTFDKYPLPHGIGCNPVYVLSSVREPGVLEVELEKNLIEVVPGQLPSIPCNIILKKWNRDTSQPVEVSYPGIGFMNALPNNLEVFSGSGRMDPAALARFTTADGHYIWNESYSAKLQAKPGIYQVPIIVRQQGSGEVQVVLTVKVVPNNKITYMTNKVQPSTPTQPVPPSPVAPLMPTNSQPSPWGRPVPPTSHPMTHTPTYTPPAPTPTHTPTYTPPAPTPTHTPPAPTPTDTRITPVIPRTPPKADWRNMPGFWAGGNGSVVAVQRHGNFVSGWFVKPGSNMDQFAGEWCFVNAVPTSPYSDTVTTETGYCYQYTGTNRAARVYPGAHMSIKISPDGNSLTYTYNCRGMDDEGEKTAVDTRTTWSGTVPRPGAVPTSTSSPAPNTPSPTTATPSPVNTPRPSTPTSPGTPHGSNDHHAETPGTGPATTPGAAPSHHENKPTGFAGTWRCETFGAITFTDYVGGRCRGVFHSDASAKGYFDGYAANGVFNGVYNFEYYGEKKAGRLVIKVNPERTYVFRADWTSTSGDTGYWNGAKVD